MSTASSTWIVALLALGTYLSSAYSNEVVIAYQIKNERPSDKEQIQPEKGDSIATVDLENQLSDVIDEVRADDADSKIADQSELVARANQLYNEDEYAQCAKILENVISRFTAELGVWETLGWCYWKMGEIDKTIDLWKRMTIVHGGDPKAYNLLGQACLSSDDRLESAIAAFEKSLEIEPDQMDILYSLGAAHRWAGNLKSAVAILARCRLANPDDRDTALQLAKALMSSRMYADALPIWEELIEDTPDKPDLLAQYARTLLHQGLFAQALEQAEKALELKTDNAAALEVVATVAGLQGDPKDVIEYQKLLLKISDGKKEKIRVLQKIIEQDRLLWEQRDGDYDMPNAAAAAAMLLELDPEAVSTHVLLGEILLLQGRLADAEEKLKFVLRKFNPRNIRVLRNLLEIYTAENRYDQAEKILREIQSINPRDPYLHYYRARLNFARGHYLKAFDQLEQLERVGAGGSVAVLLYHGLSDSKFDTIMTVERFEEQLRAFRDADFKFITPLELEDYFEYRNPPPHELNKCSPERVVVVTFDDARLDALELGTPIANLLGVRFAMHVPPPYVGRADGFFADWKTLKHYQDTGRWVFGSHLQHASDMALLNDKGTTCRPLPNRLWLPEEERKETLDEYRARVVHEYADSRSELKAELGDDCEPLFVAYPYGDIGQQTISDVVDVIENNLEQARANYQIGFIQSIFGYAVRGDDPLLYQRREPRPHQSGEQVLANTIANHPVFLARHTRAQFHALRGDFYAARHMIELLERDDYPHSKLVDLRQYVNSRLSGKGRYLEAGEDAPDLPAARPVLGLEFEHIEDSTDRSNLRTSLNASLRVLPNLELGAFGGIGDLQQNYSEPATGTEIELQIDELNYGARLAFDLVTGDLSMSPIELDFEGGQRDFSGDAEYSQMFYNGMIGFSPRPPLALQLYYEHDAVPWARSITAEKTYNLLQPLTVLRPTDYWNLTAVYSNYDYSDDNSADHINLTSMWDIHSDWGLSTGLRYSYLTSDQERDDYWTPYKLNRYMALIELRRRIARTSYRLQLRAGIGQEDLRPEQEQRYRQDLQQALAANFDVLPQKPETEWTEVYGFSANLKYALNRQLSLRGEASHNELPDYDSTTLRAWIEYQF